MRRIGSFTAFFKHLVHLHRSAWALSWERRAPARLQKPRWSVAFPAKAHTQQVLRKCTRYAMPRAGGPQEVPAATAGCPPRAELSRAALGQRSTGLTGWTVVLPW